YTPVERRQGRPRGQEIGRYDAASGAREVLASAAQLVAPGDTAGLVIESYAWSPDLSRVLIFTNAQRVWRTNSRGDYWVLDRLSGRLRKLGGPAARPSSLMFAKFSPDGSRVAYVRDFNLYVEDLATGRITALTRGGSRTIINGTFDWVYEEELMDYWADGWRWSPDGRSIAYWQLDATGVRDFDLINDTDSLYSFVMPVQYPKAGGTNSAARIGVVSAAGGVTRWMQVPGAPRDNYLARMEWAPSGDAVLIQQLNRLQNTLTLYAADPRSGGARVLVEERNDRGWVDPDTSGPPAFLAGGRSMIWQSERSGWRHLYQATLAEGGALRPITQGDFDVLSRVAVDTTDGWVYYVASPDNPARRYLFRARLDGRGPPERLSPADQPGTHSYAVAPGARFAFHTFSRFGVPPVVELVGLPDHRVLRTLVDNAQLRQRVAALRRGAEEWFQVDAGNGLHVGGWMIKPPDFDPNRRYPLFLFEYGGPLPDIQSSTVADRWLRTDYLWFTLLAQHGYVVASVENRGTGARGRDWRQATYGQLGVIESEDVAGAARAMGRWPFIDSTRIGIYGHSYGGFMALNVILRHPEVFSTAIAAAPVT
ncbi:MAG: S9 family peptidase, partial [Gemmatimonadota bacterium]